MSDNSGTITTGGTAQSLCPANVAQQTIFVGNPDPVNDLWIAGNGLTALANGQGSIRIQANGGGIFITRPDPAQTAWTIVGAVTGQKYTSWLD